MKILEPQRNFLLLIHHLFALNLSTYMYAPLANFINEPLVTTNVFVVLFLSQLISYIVKRDWNQLVRVCNLDNWREVLAMLVTYASPEEFSHLCG